MKNKLTKEAQRVKQGVLFSSYTFFFLLFSPFNFCYYNFGSKVDFLNISTPQFEKVERNSLENDE